MGEAAELAIEQAMWDEVFLFDEERSRRPIWIDKSGKEYWRWKDIDDTHLMNIIASLEKRGIDVPRKFYHERKKRDIVLNAQPIMKVKQSKGASKW